MTLDVNVDTNIITEPEPEESSTLSVKSAALQRRLWSKTRSRSLLLNSEFRDSGEPCIQKYPSIIENIVRCEYEDQINSHSHPTCRQGYPVPQSLNAASTEGWVTLDASKIGDFPAVYHVPAPLPHEQPVVGVYIDSRVCTGFQYIIRPLAEKPNSKRLPTLFGGQPLTLQSIGRGYARRLTFAPPAGQWARNDYYFWTDSNPQGFAFSLQVVNPGDKFTVLDANRVAQGTLEVVQLQGPQQECAQKIKPGGHVEKRVLVSALCSIRWFEPTSDDNVPVLVTGVAIASRPRGKALSVHIVNVALGAHHRRGLTLLPGVKKSQRRITVDGATCGDIPTKYTVLGIEDYEIPVVGTYVDSRIIPGFHYRVRLASSGTHLFNGRYLLLQSIGIGYGKRLTFASDSSCTSNNCMWSDSHPGGLGFETRAVHAGMTFEMITSDGLRLGVATVFRADLPQVEESTELIKTPSGRKCVQKRIHVEVTCHIQLATTGGSSAEGEVHLMRMSGVAILRKEPRKRSAELIRIDKVGLDAQLNLLFIQAHTQLSFFPVLCKPVSVSCCDQ